MRNGNLVANCLNACNTPIYTGSEIFVGGTVYKLDPTAPGPYPGSLPLYIVA